MDLNFLSRNPMLALFIIILGPEFLGTLDSSIGFDE